MAYPEKSMAGSCFWKWTRKFSRRFSFENGHENLKMIFCTSYAEINTSGLIVKKTALLDEGYHISSLKKIPKKVIFSFLNTLIWATGLVIKG